MGNRKFWIETYGCQMNKAESEALKLSLLDNEWSPAESHENADLVILNTCSVRKTAENRIWGRLGFYRHEKVRRDFKLAVMGCMTERLKEEFSREAPEVDVLIGNFQKQDIIQFINEAFSVSGHAKNVTGTDYSFSRMHTTDKTKAFIPIMHGCNNYCTYCIVPYLRGPEISRDPRDIIREIAQLEEAGLKEITLLGQNVNSFSYTANGTGCDFTGLLKMILSTVKNMEWIRFMTSHPKDFNDTLIRLIASEEKLCKHIHLPVQHGSEKILAAMGRKYTRQGYLALVEKIKKSIPEASISTDILIGFPGETEDDFSQTLDLIREVGFNQAYTYRYNPREGTKAYEMKDTVPDEIIKARLSQLIEVQREITRRKKKERIGRRVKILVEDHSKKTHNELLGRTERDEMVVFRHTNARIGEMAEVELTALRGNTFVGKEVSGKCPGN